MPKKDPRWKLRCLAALLCAVLNLNPVMAQSVTNRPARPTPPTRDPNTPGFVMAMELPDETNAPADSDGNFIIGPAHHPAPEMITNALQGTVFNFTMSSADSKIYPGIARDAGTFGTPD